MLRLHDLANCQSAGDSRTSEQTKDIRYFVVSFEQYIRAF